MGGKSSCRRRVLHGTLGVSSRALSALGGLRTHTCSGSCQTQATPCESPSDSTAAPASICAGKCLSRQGGRAPGSTITLASLICCHFTSYTLLSELLLDFFALLSENHTLCLSQHTSVTSVEAKHTKGTLEFMVVPSLCSLCASRNVLLVNSLSSPTYLPSSMEGGMDPATIQASERDFQASLTQHIAQNPELFAQV